MIIPCVNGQNTRRAFKILEKADYEKATELFGEAIAENKENPAALLGLTLILADEKSPSFDLISAWKYASSINALSDRFSTDDLEYIGEYFYNTEERHINRPVKKKIEYVVETVEAKLIKYIREENNLELVYHVLDEFPTFRHFDNIIHIRNQLEFRKYEKQNTLEAYMEFIQKFPDAAQIEKAKRYRNKLAFENACSLNTVQAYQAYLQQYPDAIEANPAIKNLHAAAFINAKKVNSIQALEIFMAEYPDALEIFEARQLQKQLLYEYAKKIQTLDAYNEFIRKYPEGQQYIDIFNLKSLDNGMRFISAHPILSNNIQWARSFDGEEIDEISACLTVDTLNNYLIGSTVFRSDTGYTDAWIIKVNSDGKMLWNNYIGEPFNDEVSLLRINNRNEILGAGYTWTGTDSASRESWIFKLAPDGSRLWSRKLGRMHIRTVTTTMDGSILVGGYLVNDSLQDLYSVAVLNDQGKKLWARTYTGRGNIIHAEELPDGNLLMAGTGWCAKLNRRGYLLWEHRFNESDSIIACRLTGTNTISFLAMRDSVKLILIGRDTENKPLVEKVLDLPEIRFRVTSVIRDNKDGLVALISFDDHQSVIWIDTRNSNIPKSSRLPAGINFTAVVADQLNNLLIEACNGEIILVKNNGLTF